MIERQSAENDASDDWSCPGQGCRAAMSGGLFCRACGQRRPEAACVIPPVVGQP